MVNVAIVSDWFGPGGGLGAYSRLIADLYVELGFDVIKVGLISKDEADFQLNTDPSILGRFCGQLLAKNLEELKKNRKIEFVHANILNASHGFTFANAAKKLNLPYILTTHTYVFLCPLEMYCNLPSLVPCKKPFPNNQCIKCVISKSKSQNYVFRKSVLSLSRMVYNMYSLRYLMKHARYVISPSKIFATLIKKDANLRNKVGYIQNPIDLRFLENSPHFKGDGSVFFWGRLEFAKGAHLLISLAKTLAHTPIHVIGYGTLDNWILQNKPPNLIYHGYAEKPELIKMAEKASVVVVPSIGHEMFSYTVSEAFALGKPVVAFDLGGPKEQIEASGGGLLAKPFDIKDFSEKVKWLLENSSEASMMGAHARNWAEHFLHPSRYLKQLTDVLHVCALH